MSWRDRAIKVEEPKKAKSGSWRDRAIKVEPKVSNTESALRGVGQGVTLGFSDELIAAGKGLYDDVASAFTGEPANPNAPKPVRDENGRVTNADELVGNYDEYIKEEREKNRKARDANPLTYGSAEVGGAVATSFIPGLNALNAAKGARMASLAGKGALAGGISAAGLSEADNLKDLAIDTATGATIGLGTAGLMGAAGKGLSRLGQGTKKVAPKVFTKTGSLASGVDEEALARQMARPTQTAAAEADDFVYNISQKALDEIDDQTAKAGKQVGKAGNQFLKDLGELDFSDEAAEIAREIDTFVKRNAPSKAGFSALKKAELEELQRLSQALKEGANGEDLFKLRQYLDSAKNLAKKYDKEEVGPFITFLKKIRHDADTIVDSNFSPLDDANKSFSQLKQDKTILGLNNERTAESTVSNLFGANKTAKQKSAQRLLGTETLEQVKDVSSNKAFEGAKRPGGDNYFRRGALAAVTMGASEIATNPNNWKYAARLAGKGLPQNISKMGKFTKPLMDAASRGNSSLAATHFILSQQSEEYRKKLEEQRDEEQSD